MKITKFKITNYKSFKETDEIFLTSGINIISGQNNSGKTALIESLSTRFASLPHRSSKNQPSSSTPVAPNSLLNIQIEYDKNEFVELYQGLGKNTFVIRSMVGKDHNGKTLASLLDDYFPSAVTINCTILNGQLQSSFFDISNKNLEEKYVTTFYGHSSQLIQQSKLPTETDTSLQYVEAIRQRFYSFKAERLNISTSPSGANTVLNSNASNLAEVISNLQSDPIRLQEYNSLVRRVFPSVYQITVKNLSSNSVQIVCWNEDPKYKRLDLAVPLSECGTGISQVLAILYVVVTSDQPKVILIDEPNSFLHPGASRKLIEILKEFSQHQFIISTHSTSTIAASNAKTILLIKYENAESKIESLDIEDTNKQQLYLAEIGAKLSDVFGADNVLWVEGKTEEICFQKIIEKTNGLSLMGTSILSVINTGDFQTKKKPKELVYDIYNKLSIGKGLMPPAVGFVFDREKLTENEIEDFSRKGDGKVRFISRSMFENYLLNPIAIGHVLKMNLPESNIEAQQISEWINKNKWNKTYIKQEHFKDKKDEEWLMFGNGAKLLAELFNFFSETKLSFNKIEHSVALCEWILEHEPNDLKEIQDLLKSILSE